MFLQHVQVLEGNEKKIERGKTQPSSPAFMESTQKINEMTDVGDRCPNISSIVRLNELTQEEQLENSLIIV